jgi:galactokinase
MDLNKLKEQFRNIYSNSNEEPSVFFSPGRVNLIGEHTDYNDGFVLPCALNYGTYLIALPNKEGKLRLRTLNFDYHQESDIADFSPNKEGEWVNYPLGVADQFRQKGISFPGLDMLYWGDIPNGAGLSSSASIEMVTAVALNYFSKTDISTLDLVKMSQRAEHEFAGMNCGIMDQFAVGFGEKDKALFLNCGNLKYDTVPLVLDGYDLVIVNSNKRRGLTDSKYNERRSECEEAVRILNPVTGINSLSELGPESLELVRKSISNDIIRRRAIHVITENARVMEAVALLYKGDIEGVGQMMYQSHDSLRDNYEVTGIELDTLARVARETEGVVGARMTGAGFGGCTVNIVKKDATNDFIRSLGEKYQQATGLEATFYLPSTEGGARRIS